MTLGVDAYLSWAPADIASGDDWLRVKSDLVEEAARDIREAGERGTATIIAPGWPRRLSPDQRCDRAARRARDRLRGGRVCGVVET